MLKTRIFTAIALLACFIPALFFLNDQLWAGVMLLLSLVALYEWSNLIGLSTRQTQGYLIVSFAVAVALMWQMTLNFHGFLFNSLLLFAVASVFWIACVPIWLARGFHCRNVFINIGMGWLMLGSLWLALVCAKRIDPWLLLIIISTIWIADSAAYFAGKRFGKHKLAPSISPGKTWEGVMGAIIAVSLFALGLCLFIPDQDWIIIPGLCLVSVLGIYGDLLESFFKRQANLKDSGQILPGHGGILDRIDGVIPALPVAIFVMYIYYSIQAMV
ncbi:MAG: phosphatidate cytidylyltransferase [Methylophilales bacterium 28-44-11]|jgi:phosphatidate cytidylyltransferase|nr:MAG: phosphatidate cytidylyltransferase [Methylophilales bacterium 28-44-11]